MSDDAWQNKVVEDLLKILKVCNPDHLLNVVLTLKQPHTPPAELGPTPEIRDFSDRVEWRKALIKRQEKYMELIAGSTIQSLKDLGVNPRGGFLGNVIITGKPEQIRNAIALDEVESADNGDREIIRLQANNNIESKRR